jgi:hypothetical protein
VKWMAPQTRTILNSFIRLLPYLATYNIYYSLANFSEEVTHGFCRRRRRKLNSFGYPGKMLWVPDSPESPCRRSSGTRLSRSFRDCFAEPGLEQRDSRLVIDRGFLCAAEERLMYSHEDKGRQDREGGRA